MPKSVVCGGPMYFRAGCGPPGAAGLDGLAACSFRSDGVGALLGVEQALVVLARELGVNRQPQRRAIGPLTGQGNGELDPFARPRQRGDIGSVLLGGEDLLSRPASCTSPKMPRVLTLVSTRLSEPTSRARFCISPRPLCTCSRRSATCLKLSRGAAPAWRGAFRPRWRASVRAFLGVLLDLAQALVHALLHLPQLFADGVGQADERLVLRLTGCKALGREALLNWPRPASSSVRSAALERASSSRSSRSRRSLDCWTRAATSPPARLGGCARPAAPDPPAPATQPAGAAPPGSFGQ